MNVIVELEYVDKMQFAETSLVPMNAFVHMVMVVIHTEVA